MGTTQSVIQTFRTILSTMDKEQMLQLNKMLVDHLRTNQRRERAIAGADFDRGDKVAFVATNKRYRGRTIQLVVDYVTPAGVVHGTDPVLKTKWRVAAQLCRHVEKETETEAA